MILARICKPDGTALVHTGTVRLEPYDGKKDGWFPVDSFNFGFVEKQQQGNQTGGPSQAAKPGAAATPHAAAGAAGQGGKSQDFAEARLEKQVDMVSGSLMHLAMQERKTKKGSGKDQALDLQVDVHFVSSISLEKLEDERCTYTSLMIHLEAVNIQNWEIRGSGDSRPTESVALRFDRAAMVYVGTGDGKEFHVDTARGWDQTGNKKFDWDPAKMQKYFPAQIYIPGGTISS